MARIQTSSVLDLTPLPCIGYLSVKGENMIRVSLGGGFMIRLNRQSLIVIQNISHCSEVAFEVENTIRAMLTHDWFPMRECNDKL